jgi:hypothetical protein
MTYYHIKRVKSHGINTFSGKFRVDVAVPARQGTHDIT